VVIPEPCYSLYPDLVRLAGGEPVLVAPAADLHWDRDALAAALEGARLIVYSNPCNPTGVVHTADELAWLSEQLAGSDTLVLSDEAYDAIVFEPGRFRSALSVKRMRERTIYCQTLSKTYAMTGWRVGYLAGPEAAIAAAGRVHRTFNGSVNAAVQHAAITALAGGDALSEPMLEAYRDRRAVIMRRLEKIPGLVATEPDGTFYVFARYDLQLASTVVADALKAAGVIVRPGAEYGPSGEGHIRFAFTVGTDELELAMDRVEHCLEELRQGRMAATGGSLGVHAPSREPRP
jgi:aspartate aminotransferase